MSELVVQDQEQAPELYVVFKVADVDYALSTQVVEMMESFRGATRVPGAPPFVAGIIQIRGKVYPVVDLRLRFGLPPAPVTIDSRVVVARVRDRLVALLVDSGREVMKLPRAALKPPPKLLEDAAGGFVESVAQFGGRMVLVLDFPKIIGEETLDGV